MVSDHSDSEREKLLLLVIRSGESVYHERSEQAVVAHACHGHRYWPSLVPLSGTEKTPEGWNGEGLPALAWYKRVQVVLPWSVACRGCLSVIRNKVIFYMHHIKNIFYIIIENNLKSILTVTASNIWQMTSLTTRGNFI